MTEFTWDGLFSSCSLYAFKLLTLWREGKDFETYTFEYKSSCLKLVKYRCKICKDGANIIIFSDWFKQICSFDSKFSNQFFALMPQPRKYPEYFLEYHYINELVNGSLVEWADPFSLHLRAHEYLPAVLHGLEFFFSTPARRRGANLLTRGHLVSVCLLSFWMGAAFILIFSRRSHSTPSVRP